MKAMNSDPSFRSVGLELHGVARHLMSFDSAYIGHKVLLRAGISVDGKSPLEVVAAHSWPFETPDTPISTNSDADLRVVYHMSPRNEVGFTGLTERDIARARRNGGRSLAALGRVMTMAGTSQPDHRLADFGQFPLVDVWAIDVHTDSPRAYATVAVSDESIAAHQRGLAGMGHDFSEHDGRFAEVRITPHTKPEAAFPLYVGFSDPSKDAELRVAQGFPAV